LRKPQSEHELFQWISIQSIAGNDLTKLIAAIPIVGYLILFNDQFATALSFKTIAGSHDSATSPFWMESVTKLRLSLFGSLLVLTSNLVFRVYNPKVLTIASGDLDFCEKVVSNYSRTEIIDIEKQVISDSWVIRSNLFNEDGGTGFSYIKDKKTSRISGFNNRQYLMRERSEYIRNIAREWWAGQMHSRWIARYACLLFAVVGYLMLFIPTLDILQAVIRDLIL